MRHLPRDIVRALGVITRERTFSATVLLTLGLCLGANVAIFGVVHSVLLAPLPFREPDRLVTVFNSYPEAGAPRGDNGAVDYFERRENVPAFDDVAILQATGRTVGEAGGTERVSMLRVSASYLPLLGVDPVLGRGFLEEEMERGNHYEVVLTDAAWDEYFGRSQDVVGRELRVDGRAYTVVGVMGEDFIPFGNDEARLLVPIDFAQDDRGLQNWHSNQYQMIARLAPGATVEQARAQNAALNESLMDRSPMPNIRQILRDTGYETVVVPTEEDLVRDARPILYLLWAGVAFVLLIGCVNVANLMLARAQTRVSETATKLALGASRARVAGQVFTESVVLGLVGGALGLGLGAVGLRLLMSVGAAELPRGTEIGIDAQVLLFTLALAIAAGAFFGAIPVVGVMRGELAPVFRGGGRGRTASRRAVWARNALVTSQVGLAFVMLIGAGLMLMSFRAALSVDPGFEPEGLFTAAVSIPMTRYPTPDDRRQFWDGLLNEVRAIPTVTAASVTTQMPFTPTTSSSVIFPEGYEVRPGESLVSPYQSRVGPGYFEAMGIELLRGRTFEESDGPDATPVVVIDEWLANRYWPEGGAIASRMIYGVVPGMDSIPEENLLTVIGVVETVKQTDLTAPDAEHHGAYYFSYRQQAPAFGVLAVRTATAQPSSVTDDVRSAVTSLDAELPLFWVETMQDRLSDSLRSRRVPLLLIGVFAGVALLLAVVGIYGALAYTVTQRTREIGIRIAIGSAPGDVFRAVVGQGLRVTAVGLVVGVIGASLLTRLIASLLFEVEPTDVRVMAAVAVILATVAAAACAVPARRATRVNPVEALEG